ncbi:AraC family transcriptional regulator [Thalassobaculum sp.]|uniref:helix-turn-helix domain-containing protein n=1 Tax=Thalassobaculum sp. TaxID=2022740 RepID=UPI0032ECB560
MSGAISVHHGDFGRAALYELDRPIVTHAHREGHLIFYVDGGHGKVTVGDQVLSADEMSGVAISPWEPHSFAPSEQLVPCLCLVLYIKPMWFLEASQSGEFVLGFGNPKVPMTPDVAQWVTRLTSLLLDKQASTRFDGFLFETTRLCFDECWRGVEARSRLRNRHFRFNDYRVRRSLRLMQESFTEDVEIDNLARDVGLSRPHFYKLFKMQMGITPNIFLNTLRAEQAIEDLMGTNKSVTDIGFDLGFSSQASFTRFFASNVGIPPSEYRRVAHFT